MPHPKKSNIVLAAKYLAKYGLRASDGKYRRLLNGKESWSQAGQDLFALTATEFKAAGSYVEIGAHDPIRDSNSYLLERDYGWRGVSFEIDEEYAYFFNRKRVNGCILADATRVDYEKEFAKANLPQRVDYLQIDIDPAGQSLLALKALPLESYRFAAITFEHDRYQVGDSVMVESRGILNKLGYVLLFPNIQNLNLDVEDWWVDPNQVSSAVLQVRQTASCDFREAIRLLFNCRSKGIQI